MRGGGQYSGKGNGDLLTTGSAGTPAARSEGGTGGKAPPPADSSTRAKNEAGMLTGWRRWLYVGLGCIFLGLGSVGAFLPGLPTTPFLILASYFLIRSSPRLHRRMLQSRTFGPLLRDWERHRGLKRGVKRFAIAACSVMIGLSILFGGLPWPARALVAVVGAYGIWFVARLPVVPESG